MRGVVVLALAIGALIAAAAGGAAGTSSHTALNITYWAKGTSASRPVVWTLRCNPARGTLRDPRTACRRLAAGGAKLFAPVPAGQVCIQIYGGPQFARIVGAVRGKRVWATFRRTDGCQIDRWDRLTPWLLPRAGVT